jgi:hypothetical protein
MTQNVFVAVASVVGIVLLATSALDWVLYTGFLFSLLWL